MSKVKKLKKDKKKMSPRTKNILVNSFKGIISNQACIDNGKEAPWWLAILFLLFSILIPLIPNHVHLNNAYGASFLNNGTFGLDDELAKATVQLKHDGHTLTFGEDGLLSYNNPNGVADGQPFYTSINSDSHQYRLRLFFTTKTGAELSEFVNTVATTEFKLGTTEVYNPTEDPEGVQVRYIPNFILFTPYTMACAVYKNNTTTRAGNTFGGLNWVNTPKDVELFTRLAEGVTSTTAAEIIIVKEEVKTVFKNWITLFNETYYAQKNETKWNTTLIYLGVYAGLMFFLGLMVFLLTRGKNNPFSSLNFWVCQKIGYFLGFTPAVLALVLGFIFAANVIGQMAFIMLISLRVMWASMRQLRPVAY